jgi:hypothetical protein
MSRPAFDLDIHPKNDLFSTRKAIYSDRGVEFRTRVEERGGEVLFKDISFLVWYKAGFGSRIRFGKRCTKLGRTTVDAP